MPTTPVRRALLTAAALTFLAAGCTSRSGDSTPVSTTARTGTTAASIDLTTYTGQDVCGWLAPADLAPYGDGLRPQPVDADKGPSCEWIDPETHSSLRVGLWKPAGGAPPEQAAERVTTVAGRKTYVMLDLDTECTLQIELTNSVFLSVAPTSAAATRPRVCDLAVKTAQTALAHLTDPGRLVETGADLVR